MRARNKFILGGAMIMGSAGYLMASAISETGTYYLTPTELAEKVARDPGLHDTGIKLGARVVPGTIRREGGGKLHHFQVTDGAQTYAVTYRGIAPDTFTDGVDVVVEGRLSREGTFQATTLLAKCASRYESAPEKYQDTPGYKAAAQRQPA